MACKFVSTQLAANVVYQLTLVLLVVCSHESYV